MPYDCFYFGSTPPLVWSSGGRSQRRKTPPSIRFLIDSGHGAPLALTGGQQRVDAALEVGERGGIEIDSCHGVGSPEHVVCSGGIVDGQDQISNPLQRENPDGRTALRPRWWVQFVFPTKFCRGVRHASNMEVPETSDDYDILYAVNAIRCKA